MTHEQIIWNIVISFFVGLFLIVVGAILQPLLKRMWQHMNRPMPLTPQTRGQLVTNRAIWEAELERLNYLSIHTKDLFLRLIQWVMVVLLMLVAMALLYTVRLLALGADMFLILVLVMLIFAGLFSVLGVKECDRLSDKKIDATKGSIQKRIAEIDRQLNPPA
jgi:hypothetical protein